jgi:biopolymer transport protein ExbB
MRYLKRLPVPLVIIIFFTLCSHAHAWWNEGWQYRKKLTFDTTENGAGINETLNEIPVLVRLHAGNFNFSNAKEDGSDLRFVAPDDLTLLKHHVERFDVIDEIALVWVKVPKLSGNTNQDAVWLYYGSASAMGGQDAKSTYDSGYAAVMHFAEVEGTPQDAGAAGNHAAQFSGGQGLPSVIGTGVALNGGGDRMMISSSPTLNFSNGFTISFWVRISMGQSDAVLFSRANADSGFIIGLEGTKIFAAIRNGEEVTETDRGADIAPNQWHHVSVTVKPGERMTLYVDGLQMFYTPVGQSLPSLTEDITVGAAADGSRSYVGELDELEISTVPRTADAVRAAYASQGPDGLLYALGVEEMGGGGGGLPIFYLGTIFKNITLDGWLVIVLLLILGVFSWVVFLSKLYFLWTAQRDDQGFSEDFTKQSDLFSLYENGNGHSDNQNDDHGNGFENSTLYRVYSVGCETLERCLSNPEMLADDSADLTKQKQLDEAVNRPSRLRLKGLNAVKAALEKGFIQENKRLNAWLLVLTLAITGGPFLGLLGTVWGVMNTFAAMAEAGEANIMAIAPGVASALSTTVFGLIVAIPALFGYNILADKVKNIMADLTVFIDEFNVKVDEIHG